MTILKTRKQFFALINQPGIEIANPVFLASLTLKYLKVKKATMYVCICTLKQKNKTSFCRPPFF